MNFSRYELIQTLGWRHEGKSYKRLEQSLKHWLGVTLYYDKAWWDKEQQSWVDENFHILERVVVYDKERRLERMQNGNSEPPLSSFTWNEVVFRSFKSGNLKTIDMDLYRSKVLPLSECIGFSTNAFITRRGGNLIFKNLPLNMLVSVATTTRGNLKENSKWRYPN